MEPVTQTHIDLRTTREAAEKKPYIAGTRISVETDIYVLHELRGQTPDEIGLPASDVGSSSCSSYVFL